jgi:flagellar protein FlaJ
MPSFNKSSIEGRVSSELPFAIIYMSAIAGVNVDPTKIFKLVANSPEYPNVGIEMKKVINQIEIYGYDLVTALKSVSKITTNVKLAQLLNGMAINISTGSSLKNFLEKQSDNLLADYKLDRERYNSIATTFMDVYISVLVTAPLVMVMLIVIMDLTSLKVGNLSANALVGISIGLVALINVIFLIFLQIKQPKT